MVLRSVGPWVLRSVGSWVLVITSGIACTKTEPPPPGAIVVGMTNSALDLDPRVATDEEVDTLIERAAQSPNDNERRTLYSQAQQMIAADVPYVPLWYRVNVAVCQPDIHGVSLSPIADFTFLKDVYRSGS